MVITLFLILKTGTQNWTPYKFNRVFDVAFYKQNYKAYLRRLFIDAVLKRDIYAQECYAILGKKISLMGKVLILIDVIINKLIHRKVIV